MEDRIEPGASNARRRSEVDRGPARHLIDDRLCLADLGDETGGRKESERVWMTPRVVLDAVSAFNHFADQGGVLFNKSADTKKAGPRSMLVEDIKNTRRKLRVWTVVKCHGYGPRPVHMRRNPGQIGPEDSAPGEKPSEEESCMVGNHRPNSEWPHGWFERDRPKSQNMDRRGSGDECGRAVSVASHDPMLTVGSSVPLICRWSTTRGPLCDRPCLVRFLGSDLP